MAIEDAVARVDQFKGTSLTETIGTVESRLAQASVDTGEVDRANRSLGINLELLLALADVKRASAEIVVVIHAVGILYALPHILRPTEVVEALSLGAGSAGSDFDLVTDQRIAEFKFIHWQGGSEAMRKKTLFQDFFRLAREDTDKEKYLYLLNTRIPLRFLRGRSNTTRLLDRNRRLATDFARRYGQMYRTVGEYYEVHQDQVRLVNLVEVVPGFDAFMNGLQ
ncbi:MAG: hypothetical protein H8D78_03720 [Chloroflexi bacterium]|nr:hypothetical protein [Chloroflexota bacterium]